MLMLEVIFVMMRETEKKQSLSVGLFVIFLAADVFRGSRNLLIDLNSVTCL